MWNHTDNIFNTNFLNTVVYIEDLIVYSIKQIKHKFLFVSKSLTNQEDITRLSEYNTARTVGKANRGCFWSAVGWAGERKNRIYLSTMCT